MGTWGEEDGQDPTPSHLPTPVPHRSAYLLGETDNCNRTAHGPIPGCEANIQGWDTENSTDEGPL